MPVKGRTHDEVVAEIFEQSQLVHRSCLQMFVVMATFLASLLIAFSREGPGDRQ